RQSCALEPSQALSWEGETLQHSFARSVRRSKSEHRGKIIDDDLIKTQRGACSRRTSGLDRPTLSVRQWTCHAPDPLGYTAQNASQRPTASRPSEARLAHAAPRHEWRGINQRLRPTLMAATRTWIVLRNA